jgi:DNA-binding NarL/FixJ family response regulator
VVIAEPGARRRVELDRQLSASGSVDVIGQAADAKTGVALALRSHPGVVLIGPGFPAEDAAEASRLITESLPGVRVLAMLTDPEGQTAYDVLMAGASGALPETTPSGELPEVVEEVACGKAAISGRLAAALLRRFQFVAATGDGLRPLAGPLSSREWQVLDAMRTGASPEAAAADLGIKRATIYSHLRNISRKMGATSRAEAMDAAERLRLREGRGLRTQTDSDGDSGSGE